MPGDLGNVSSKEKRLTGESITVSISSVIFSPSVSVVVSKVTSSTQLEGVI